ncbi:MAG: hypothetical protein JO359_03655 [Candidatus Eremiobacteraeota bacterium]|nr:hypothetical protein [Candidatus Eremiobacteraeota bacterium]
MGQVTLGTTQTLVDALGRARRAELDAYVLANRRLIAALGDAASRGCDVHVRLCKRPHGDARLGRTNEALARRLRARGVEVTLAPAYGPHSRHDKVALVGSRLFIDDRNWRSSPDETIVIQRARSLRTQTKAAALELERRLLAGGRGHDVLVSTETLGPGPIADVVAARARRGDRVRLLYNAAEGNAAARETTVRKLRAAGVELRPSTANHKVAVVGNRAWLGSANATAAGAGAGRESGVLVGGTLARTIRERAEQIWRRAQ